MSDTQTCYKSAFIYEAIFVMQWRPLVVVIEHRHMVTLSIQLYGLIANN